MMDKESRSQDTSRGGGGAPLQDTCTLVGFCNSSVQMEACRRCDVVWILHVHKIAMLQSMGNTTNLKDG
jgi:hypothetical protein